MRAAAPPAERPGDATDAGLPATVVGLTPLIDLHRGSPSLRIQVLCDSCEPGWLIQVYPAPPFTAGVSAGDTIGRVTAVVDPWHRSAPDSLLLGETWPEEMETWMAAFASSLGCRAWLPGTGTPVWCRAPADLTAPWAEWARRVNEALDAVSAEEAAAEAAERQRAGACREASAARLIVERRTAAGARRVYMECIDPAMRMEVGAGSAVYRVADEVIAWHLGLPREARSWRRAPRSRLPARVRPDFPR